MNVYTKYEKKNEKIKQKNNIIILHGTPIFIFI